MLFCHSLFSLFKAFYTTYCNTSYIHCVLGFPLWVFFLLSFTASAFLFSYFPHFLLTSLQTSRRRRCPVFLKFLHPPAFFFFLLSLFFILYEAPPLIQLPHPTSPCVSFPGFLLGISLLSAFYSKSNHKAFIQTKLRGEWLHLVWLIHRNALSEEEKARKCAALKLTDYIKKEEDVILSFPH